VEKLQAGFLAQALLYLPRLPALFVARARRSCSLGIYEPRARNTNNDRWQWLATAAFVAITVAGPRRIHTGFPRHLELQTGARKL
jgi:hypothetical protein